MKLLELKNKIKSRLIAGYPGLFIQSGEEARVDEMLQEIASQLNMSPKEWNLGYGWVNFNNKQPHGHQEESTELANCLPILCHDELDGKLFIIKDARSALENQPLAVARLKQLLNRIQRHHRGKAAVVLVSETQHIPSQLEAQITLLPLPLPRDEEIRNLLDSVCQQLDLKIPEGLHQRLHAACCGLNQEEIRSALAMVQQQHEQLNDAALALIQYEKEQIIAKSGVLEMIKVSESTANIGGLENLKSWLNRRAQIFHRLDEARQARVQAPKGVLIAGMPGCGKSLTAKAAAGMFQLPLLRLDIGSLLGKYVGESEHNMRRALTMAESVSPCILWIDELEKAFVGMNSGSGSEVSSRLFGYFLTWMQEKTGAVFVIATANNITALPPELLRKGRFDEVFYVGFPNPAERGAILDIHLRGDDLTLEPDARRALINMCRDYAGADIQNALNEARESAFLDNRKLKFEDLVSAIKLTVPLRETLREQVSKYEDLFEKLKLKPASTFEGLSIAQMIKMADDPNALRRKEVASNSDCPEDLLEKLVGDPDLEIRTAVYQNDNCPERLLSLRINIEDGKPDFDLNLLHLACIHSNAPHDLVASQFSRLKLQPKHRQLLAQKSTHESLLRQLVDDEDIEVRSNAARNKHLICELQQLLAKDPDVEVRNSLARNEVLAPKAQAQLASDESFEVRETLTQLVGLVEDVQLTLTGDDDLDVRVALAGRQRSPLLTDAVQLALAKNAVVEVRIELAQNKTIGTPTQLLLAQDSQIEVRKSLAGHPAIACEALQYLINDVEAVQVALAGSRHLNSDLLQISLARNQSENVREALAGNSQLCSEAQTILVKDANASVREALAGNESAVEEIVETLMRDESDDVRKRLVRWRDSVLPSVQRHLACDPQVEIRKCLASIKGLRDEIQHRLCNDVPEVQQELASNVCIAATTQQYLLDKGCADISLILARNTSLIEPLQTKLADNSNMEILIALAGNTGLSELVAEKLLGNAEEVQLVLAENCHLSESQYFQLFRNGSEQVRAALAGNSAITEALMIHINTYESAHNKYESAPKPMTVGNYAVPAACLASKPVSKVKLTLARNRGLPTNVQATMMAEENAPVELLQVLASNRSLSETVQQELATHKDNRVRETLAANENISSETICKLANDHAAMVRSTLITNRWLAPKIQRQLAQDNVLSVRCALAANDDLSKTVELQLARDPFKEVRASLLKRECSFFFHLKLTTQQILAKDSDTDIRTQLAAYPKLSPSVQKLLAEDKSVIVRQALAKGSEDWPHLSLNEEIQRLLARDCDINVRLALAENGRLSPEALMLLASDVNTSVKIKLIEESLHNHLPLQVQRTLAKDPDAKVRKALARRLFGFLPPPSSEEIHLILANDQDEEVRDTIVFSVTSPLAIVRGKCSAAVKARLLEGASDTTRERLETVKTSLVEVAIDILRERNHCE
ncbi:AAA family ATPase [Aeromonas veronii]|uniref:AAA family ATPase n=1 Tax=Aeromonas veronii TaxID=654 RepID=UPI00222F4B1A|nr:AAA family ATPase [Aeromonas veronii]UZE59223.1 AAA family ATPase [Aeromonas veronii]